MTETVLSQMNENLDFVQTQSYWYDTAYIFTPTVHLYIKERITITFRAATIVFLIPLLYFRYHSS